MAKVDYSDKRILLVESSGNMRAAIFYMLRSLGVTNIRATSISDRVLTDIAKGNYDIILLGHNVSDTVTGSQLLEEARFRNYIKPSACWVFMTSDASQETVLHAIDSQPDIVITKPFTVDTLKQRLDAVMLRRARFVEVDRALELGDVESAVRICLTAFSSVDDQYWEAQLIACRLLGQEGRYEQQLSLAEGIYRATKDKEAGLYWALAALSLGEGKRALGLLRELTEAHPLYVAAFDALAQVYERLGNADEAREIMKQATAKSPMGIPRQMELGRLATQTRELSTAQGAYRRSISLGQKSCHKSAEPYLKLANVHRLEIDPENDRNHLDLERRFEALLVQATAQFKDDEALGVKAALLRAEMATSLERDEDAEKFRAQAKAENDTLEQPLDLEAEQAALNAKAVSSEIAEPDDSEAEDEEGKRLRDMEMSAKVNRQGVRHYTNGRLSQALRHFGLALEYDHANGDALCNLAQMYLELARDDEDKRDARLRMFDRNMMLASRLALTDGAKQKQKALMALRQRGVEQIPPGPISVLLK